MMGTPRGKGKAKGKDTAATGAGLPLHLEEEAAAAAQPRKQGPLPPHLRPGFDASSSDDASSSSSDDDDDASSSDDSSSSEEAPRSRQGTEDGSDAHSSGPEDPCVWHCRALSNTLNTRRGSFQVCVLCTRAAKL